jgi:excisionase family DNA binding protein
LRKGHEKRDGELTVKELAERLGVRPGVVYYWIDKKLIPVRRWNGGSPYLLVISAELEAELVKWVQASKHIKPQ